MFAKVIYWWYIILYNCTYVKLMSKVMMETRGIAEEVHHAVGTVYFRHLNKNT